MNNNDGFVISLVIVSYLLSYWWVGWLVFTQFIYAVLLCYAAWSYLGRDAVVFEPQPLAIPSLNH